MNPLPRGHPDNNLKRAHRINVCERLNPFRHVGNRCGESRKDCRAHRTGKRRVCPVAGSTQGRNHQVYTDRRQQEKAEVRCPCTAPQKYFESVHCDRQDEAAFGQPDQDTGDRFANKDFNRAHCPAMTFVCRDDRMRCCINGECLCAAVDRGRIVRDSPMQNSATSFVGPHAGLLAR